MKTFKEEGQPESYTNPKDLIDWLIWDLYQQRKEIGNTDKIDYSHLKNDHDRIDEFLKTKIDNGELTLNIGYHEFDMYIEVELKFDFYLQNILNRLGIESYICPYALNAKNITFTGKAYFQGTTFAGDANFRWAKFTGAANFHDTTFNGEADFSYATFNSKADFSFICFTNTIIFKNIGLDNKSYILFENIDYDEYFKIEITNTAIKGRIEFNDVAINEIDFKGSDVMGGGVVNRINFKASPANWQTASFLKHEAIVRDNTIEALEYKAIEKEKYTKFLLDKKNKSIREWGECYSLLISKLSNNHGQSWIKGVLFVLISWFIFFVPFYELIMFSDIISKQSNFLSIDTFLSSISVYFNPTNYEILIKYLETNYNNLWITLLKIPAILIYILGKIAIGYGIVEIVQAFRKFNSKGN